MRSEEGDAKRSLLLWVPGQGCGFRSFPHFRQRLASGMSKLLQKKHQVLGVHTQRKCCWTHQGWDNFSLGRVGVFNSKTYTRTKNSARLAHAKRGTTSCNFVSMPQTNKIS